MHTHDAHVHVPIFCTPPPTSLPICTLDARPANPVYTRHQLTLCLHRRCGRPMQVLDAIHARLPGLAHGLCLNATDPRAQQRFAMSSLVTEFEAQDRNHPSGRSVCEELRDTVDPGRICRRRLVTQAAASPAADQEAARSGGTANNHSAVVSTGLYAAHGRPAADGNVAGTAVTAIHQPDAADAQLAFDMDKTVNAEQEVARMQESIF